ncbi:MAG: four helix bundle protein [Planctomycetota bacterium]|jgi:four helix bundle protein
MSEVKTHKDLEIWQRGIALVEEIYRVTKSFPKEEVYCLTSQLRRSAVSYPSNIAEGAARSSRKEYVQFLYFSLGSLSEVETQLMIAGRLGYLKPDGLLDEVEALRRS